jgi:fluoride exporter
MDKYVMITIGAILGAFCRYWLGLWVTGKLGTDFAYGTWFINLIGSFILGFFLTLHLDRGLFTPNARFLVAVGWCASFTTYSTFSWETFRYVEEGQFGLAGLNAGLTLVGCFFATWAGAVAARFL